MKLYRLTSSFRLKLIFSIFNGAISTLAFAPFNLWPIQIISLAILFGLSQHEPSVKRNTIIGWAYGFGWTLAGTYWLFISMHQYGGMPAPLAVIAVILLSLYLGSYAALAMATAAWLQQRWSSPTTVNALLILPSTWALGEWLRGWIFTGFPWVASGYAHTTSPLAGFAPIVGVYGLGWIAAFIAGTIVIFHRKKMSALYVALIFVVGIGLQAIEWTMTNGKPITVRLLQGNVPQEMKFTIEELNSSLALYHDMIHAAPADLIVTPETAIPMMLNQLPVDYLQGLSSYAQQSTSTIALGLPINDKPGQYANGLITFPPTANASQTYRYAKHHLVPFGEFIPSGFHWFVDLMHIPLGEFTSGGILQLPFAVKDQWILPNICYEDLFGEEIAQQLAASHFSNKPQGSILLNLSNIAWFGDTTAIPQHLQISQMRALETGRPMLRATNTGATAAIDHKGKILAQLPAYKTATLDVTIQGYTGTTPYILVGNYLIVAFSVLLLSIAWFFARRNRKKWHE